MSNRKGKAAPTDEELLAQLEGLSAEDPSTTQRAPRVSSRAQRPAPRQQSEADLLAELDNLAQERPASRPHTPRLSSSTAVPTPKASPKRTAAATPPPAARTSDEKALPRKSAESTRSFHTSYTPGTEAELEPEPEKGASVVPQAAQEQSSGGGWWGGIFATATAAVKQAEALAKEIKKNEEAQRWAEQVKGNVGALRGLGGELRSRALPTFTNILHTLAPPISSHERLQIHITHDFIGYPSLDPLIYQTFSRVMAQVEGGDLIVIQRGQESGPRRSSSDAGYTGSSSSGWSDGPWWRQTSEPRNLGAVKGLVEGTKLSKASAESYATDYFAPRGGVEEAAKLATQVLSDTNPVRSSDIFLAIQAIAHSAPGDLFGGFTAPKSPHDGFADPPDAPPDDLLAFAIYLHDPIHGITFHTLTQPLPHRWVQWLDAPSETSESEPSLPPEIAEIVNTGGVDPREWVAEWVEEVLALGVGVVAQRYVARRMGVGEGGIGRGKARAHAVEAGAGEAARAI
ncbi:Maintenance of telomere capping protein 1, Mtc1 [Lasallia pustulata]|uniref:Maintenance of telomere capping protein 1, Mtc1 n=1 Tax=Lasallia pustulata TaxID=136370 RepID=A0A1W5D8Y6_9LECA|nr:Maintenance of telomere capping protein 1, Mtc1 [Lasallia pustulata]